MWIFVVYLWMNLLNDVVCKWDVCVLAIYEHDLCLLVICQFDFVCVYWSSMNLTCLSCSSLHGTCVCCCAGNIGMQNVACKFEYLGMWLSVRYQSKCNLSLFLMSEWKMWRCVWVINECYRVLVFWECGYEFAGVLFICKWILCVLVIYECNLCFSCLGHLWS